MLYIHIIINSIVCYGQLLGLIPNTLNGKSRNAKYMYDQCTQILIAKVLYIACIYNYIFLSTVTFHLIVLPLRVTILTIVTCY